MGTLADKARVLYLVLLIFFLLTVGFFIFDYYGLIDADEIFPALAKKPSLVNWDKESPTEVEKLEYKKAREKLDEEIAEIERIRQSLDEEKEKLQGENEKLNEMKKSIQEKEKNMAKSKKDSESRENKIKVLANKIANMPPQKAKELLVNWPDQDIIDVFKQMDKDAVERGSQLTKKLLAFARKQVFSPEIYDLNFIIQDMYEMIERVLGKQIKVDLKISELPLPILIDKNELENVILNLAINARDAMNDVGILTIRTRQVQNPKLANEEIHNSDNVFAELSIIDTGCGIPPHLMQKIFEPFFTTKPKGKGTGLGLSLTYGFIKQSNAHIHVYSEESKGTCFKLYFLIKDNQNYPKVESTKIIEKKDSLSQDKVVLVVDDLP